VIVNLKRTGIDRQRLLIFNYGQRRNTLIEVGITKVDVILRICGVTHNSLPKSPIGLLPLLLGQHYLTIAILEDMLALLVLLDAFLH
jgi:hypothetical protein